MSHSSSGLRGVTLNDLFVVPAKRATDMRSLAETVHAKASVEKPKSAWYYLLNSLLNASLYSSLSALAFTLSDALIRFQGEQLDILKSMTTELGSDVVRLSIAAVITMLAFIVLNGALRESLQTLLPLSPAPTPKPEAGYIARAKSTRGALSLGPLKVSYAITPDALVVRSLKDHAVTVISMEMISRAILGDVSKVFGDPPIDADGGEEIGLLGIDRKLLKSWYGPKRTCPVIISLKSGEARIPLFIHGLYFDGQASEELANEIFVKEFNAALKAFRDSQSAHGHTDHGHSGHH